MGTLGKIRWRQRIFLFIVLALLKCIVDILALTFNRVIVLKQEMKHIHE